MSEPTPTRETPIPLLRAAAAELRDVAAKATPGHWAVEDCEGDLSLRAGSARTTYTRHESSDGTPFHIGSPPGSWKSTDLIAEEDLETWDRGESLDDDQRRADYDLMASLGPIGTDLLATLMEQHADQFDHTHRIAPALLDLAEHVMRDPYA